jgi:hypothetical protein
MQFSHKKKKKFRFIEVNIVPEEIRYYSTIYMHAEIANLSH